MLSIRETAVFRDWLEGLRDKRAASRITIRVSRVADGNLGDVKPVGDGVSEMRISYGPGYRVYFIKRDGLLIVLLCGGDKSSQQRDIVQAKRLAKEWKE